MTTPRTAAERHLGERLAEPEYRRAYERARNRIDQADGIVRALDARRVRLDLTKAELARRADMKPEAVRRIFSMHNPNPTLTTLVALADALDLELVPRGRTTQARSVAAGTRRRTA